MSVPKCKQCGDDAVCVDYVDGAETPLCEAHKPSRRTEQYLQDGKKKRASYVPERSEVDGVVRVIGWSLVADDGPEGYRTRGRGKTQGEARNDFVLKLAEERRS